MADSANDEGRQSSRMQSVRDVVEHYRLKRSRGESITAKSAIQAHPKLMPELAEALRHL